VGADGIRSSIRRMVFGNIEPQFTGQGVWRYTTSRPAELDYQCMYLGVGAKAGLVPLTDETMYLLLVTNEPDNPWMAADELHVLLRKRLAQFGHLVERVRESIGDPGSACTDRSRRSFCRRLGTKAASS
jgi:2-polyprenyl-6-methoxyphenol hydroxylase-like FAD-dependent oxidoreductase